MVVCSKGKARDSETGDVGATPLPQMAHDMAAVDNRTVVAQVPALFHVPDGPFASSKAVTDSNWRHHFAIRISVRL
jgi:hypothetical protein